MKKITLISLALLFILTATVQAEDPLTPKEIVSSFFKLAFVERKPIEAAKKYISKQLYIQHNPLGADGRQAFIEGFAAYIVESEYQCELKRTIAENDLVVVHSHCKQSSEDKGAAIVDIFRVQQGLIVEHWDVEQSIPKQSANTNTMF